jgi:hypothetical protein
MIDLIESKCFIKGQISSCYVSVAGGSYEGLLAEDEPIVFIRVQKFVERWLCEDEEDGYTELSWIQNNYYGTKENGIDNVIQKKRHSKVGLCAKDFLELAYPILKDSFKGWWKDTREQTEFPEPDKGHLVFVTSILDFPWSLLPLGDGRTLGSVYSVSSNPSTEFLNSFSGNDAVLMSMGALKRRDGDPGTFDVILGSDLKKKVGIPVIPGSDLKRNVGVQGGPTSLWRRSKRRGTPNEEAILVNGIMGIELKGVNDISARVFGDADTTHLPSIWFHEGHGHNYSLELGDNERTMLRGDDILRHLKSVNGSIDFCWLSSCHGIEMAKNANWMNSGKIMTLLGHLGMGDEAGNVIAFEMLVLERIMGGYSVGRAVQLAKMAMGPEMASSGSFTLLGDPRLVLVD